MADLVELTPTGLRLNLHPGQTRTWDSTARFVFMLAGSQGGKTSFGPWWLYREIYDRQIGRGSGDYLAVTSTFDLFKLKLLPELRRVFENILRVGRFWAGDKIIELKDPATGRFWATRGTDPMWGRIILRSAASPGGLESATAKAAWLDEVGQPSFELDAWEAVLRRLSLAQGRVLGTTTLYTVGWLKQQIYDRWTAGDPSIDIIQFASTVNPLFPEKEYARAQATLPTWKFLMFYRGEFAKPPGLIYGDYDEDFHKVAPFPIPAHWPRYVGIDPGGVNLATIWIAENPSTHVYYVYRETLEGSMTTKEHVEAAMKRAAGENVIVWTGGSGSEEQVRRDWSVNGLPVHEPKVHDVWSGVDRVIALFKERRLFVFDPLVRLRDELGTYSRELDAKTNEPTDKIRDKRTYHVLDALRYVTSWLELASWRDPEVAGQGKNPWSFLRDDSGVPSTQSLSWWQPSS